MPPLGVSLFGKFQIRNNCLAHNVNESRISRISFVLKYSQSCPQFRLCRLSIFKRLIEISNALVYEFFVAANLQEKVISDVDTIQQSQ